MDTRITSVIFDEDAHRYFYQGKELYGVTGIIGRMTGKSFPDNDTVRLATQYGSDVHKDVENFYNGEIAQVSSRAAKWVVDALTDFAMEQNGKGNQIIMTLCEVMVSDFEGTASKVDIVMHTNQGAFLFDIKTTSHFDRPYCSLQLSAYKTMYEQNYGEKVLGMFVLATKPQKLFRIIEQEKSRVDRIFEENRSRTK